MAKRKNDILKANKAELEAIREERDRWKSRANDAEADQEATKLVYSASMAVANAECNMWILHSKALERAIKAVSLSPCDSCVNDGKAGQQWCCDNCGPELLKWQFDDARFTPEVKDGQD